MTTATRPAATCSNLRGGRECGAPGARLYLRGPLCAECGPVVPVPDPASTLIGLLEQRAARLSEDRELRARPYFDGGPGRELVPCPDCGYDCVAALGSHMSEGACARRLLPGGRINTDLDDGKLVLAKTIIREAAERNATLSTNVFRAKMDGRRIPVKLRTRALRELLDSVITPVGYEDSTDIEASRRAGKPVRVRTYRSLVYRPVLQKADQ